MNEATRAASRYIINSPQCIDSLKTNPCINGEQFKIRFKAMFDYKRICDIFEVDWNAVYEEVIGKIN